MTTIKPSLRKNAGKGLFTTKSYKKGEYICYYDGIEKKIESFQDYTYSITNPFNNKILIGYNYKKNNEGVGQFINDYCLFELNDNDRDEKDHLFKLSSNIINKKIEIYQSISSIKANVSFRKEKNRKFKIYATRDIEENEELYLNYGIQYWISRIRFITNEPFTRLYCIIKINDITINNDFIYINDDKFESEVFLNLLRIKPNGKIINKLKLNKLTTIKKILKLISLIS
tara:strand:- start:1834 stop:2520 length:687 start_codon:yes stop_codon:yes gene_type:complete